MYKKCLECKISAQGSENQAAIIGFTLGAAGICNVVRASKTPFIVHEMEFLGLDYSKAVIAVICIFSGTFIGLFFALTIAIKINKCSYRKVIKVMLFTFWGPAYGQLVGTIVFDAGNDILGFQTGDALIALMGCLVWTVIGCAALHFIKIICAEKSKNAL
uniref:Uncharacterized protein n=1 Tax=Panagrolaimus davidi TaxID=227884 RepID=A0A914R794_9BILA